MSRDITWHPFLSREQHPALLNNLFWRGFEYVPEFVGLESVTVYRRDMDKIYFDHEEYEQLMMQLQEHITKKPSWLLKRIQSAPKKFNQVRHLVQRYKYIDWKEESDDVVMRSAYRFIDALIPTCAYVFWPIWIEQAFSLAVQKKAIRIFGLKWEHPMALAMSPTKSSTVQKFNIAITKLAAKDELESLDDDTMRKNLERLEKQFAHVRTYFFHVNPYTQEDIKKKVIKTKNFGAKQKLDDLAKKVQDKRQRIARVRAKLPTPIRRWVEVVSEAKMLREERMVWWAKLTTDAHDLLKATANVMGISYEEFIQLTMYEFETREFDREALKKRKRGYIFTGIDERVSISYPRQ